ncbi:MAG: sulfite exporter TauE/SafE family protein [Paludibacteraceae bacterium]|nr:sulfite exporter TauE/SafE family protein [Paludibacteraceae bacterium]MBR1480624.1 sulfite exporter TauE/SafE family protein [Paludibacteraceae bacterium]
MELLWKILNEIGAAILLAYFVIWAGIAYLAIRRFRTNRKKLIRAALVIVVSFFTLFSSLSAGDAFAMSLFIGGMAAPIAYGALFFRFDDSRAKKDAFLKRLLRWTLFIGFGVGCATALLNIGITDIAGLGISILVAALGAFISAGMAWVFAINIPEDDYCTQCGSYGEIYCKEEEQLNWKKVKEWDSEEWEETKRGDVTVSETTHKHYHNIRYHYTALMHLRCDHCGHEYEKMEERDEVQSDRINK